MVLELAKERAELQALARERVAVYFHKDSNTHLIQQLPGTEFGDSPITGCGATTEKASRDYNNKLYRAIQGMTHSDVIQYRQSLKNQPAECRKVQSIHI